MGHVSSSKPPHDPLLLARRALAVHRERSLRVSTGWASSAGLLLVLGALLYLAGFVVVSAFLFGGSSAGMLAACVDAVRYLRLSRTLTRTRPKEPPT